MTNVLLPLIRRVMPTIIANSIIGVSPMTGPPVSLFDMIGFSSPVEMTKVHYSHFLRVYNRRTQHRPEYITGLGYQKIRITRRADLHLDADQWCRDNLKAGCYVRKFGEFWFAYNDDAVLFKMTWQ